MAGVSKGVEEQTTTRLTPLDGVQSSVCIERKLRTWRRRTRVMFPLGWSGRYPSATKAAQGPTGIWPNTCDAIHSRYWFTASIDRAWRRVTRHSRSPHRCMSYWLAL